MPSLDKPWSHDREQIRQLHHAHADHIESLYTALHALPGNPHGAVIQRIGNVRTFLVSGDRWENRPIFHGDETHEQIDEVLHHFSSHQASCVIEINIANSYVDPPANWEPRLLPHLLARGCKPGGMRCVWYYDRSTPVEQGLTNCRIQQFLPDRISEYAAMRQMADPNDKWTPERCTVEARPGLIHYAAFNEQQQPGAFGSMFINDRTAYLSYWETRPDFRGRGFQQAGIRRRVADAFDLGCKFVFTVSDFNFASSRNLQRCGFKLAYNYLVVTRALITAASSLSIPATSPAA
jgi:RimJ/RimL family protein N-acetyltransferase